MRPPACCHAAVAALLLVAAPAPILSQGVDLNDELGLGLDLGVLAASTGSGPGAHAAARRGLAEEDAPLVKLSDPADWPLHSDPAGWPAKLRELLDDANLAGPTCDDPLASNLGAAAVCAYSCDTLTQHYFPSAAPDKVRCFLADPSTGEWPAELLELKADHVVWDTYVDQDDASAPIEFEVGTSGGSCTAEEPEEAEAAAAALLANGCEASVTEPATVCQPPSDGLVASGCTVVSGSGTCTAVAHTCTTSPDTCPLTAAGPADDAVPTECTLQGAACAVTAGAGSCTYAVRAECTPMITRFVTTSESGASPATFDLSGTTISAGGELGTFDVRHCLYDAEYTVTKISTDMWAGTVTVFSYVNDNTIYVRETSLPAASCLQPVNASPTRCLRRNPARTVIIQMPTTVRFSSVIFRFYRVVS
jgi:hypothetical protein